MAEKTTNFNLTKPPVSDFYDIEVHNDNMDIIDEELKHLNDDVTELNSTVDTLKDNVTNALGATAATSSDLEGHLSETNPHGVTATTIGLGKVPNVATNEQTPTYTEASTLAALTSGEKLSVAFGKIKKAMTDFIAHLSNENLHNKVSSSGGGAVGNGASATSGGAVGNGAGTDTGFAGGADANSIGGGVALGSNAKAKANYSIQLGTGTNSTYKTLQVYDYQLMDANGKIPSERLPIISSSYDGTGSGNVSTSIVINYDKPPRMLIIQAKEPTFQSNGLLLALYGQTKTTLVALPDTSTAHYATLTWEDKRVTITSSDYQHFNASGKTYLYMLVM